MSAHLRGRLVMMSLSGALKPSAVAGRPSVTRFTHSSCTGLSTSGSPAKWHECPPLRLTEAKVSWDRLGTGTFQTMCKCVSFSAQQLQKDGRPWHQKQA